MAKREFEFNKRNVNTDIWSECNADFVLPDYNGDVRKVLLFSATAYPSSAFPDGDYIECSGRVSFNLIYLNFEGEVESADFDGDYSFKVKCNGENYVDSIVETSVCAQGLRLLSPRKISAKAALESTVNVITRESFECDGTALEEIFDPQVREGVAKIDYIRLGESVVRDFGETVTTFDDKTVDEVRVLHAFAKSRVEDVSVEDGNACVKGIIKATVLIKTDDMPIYKVEHVFPIEECLKTELSAEDGEVSAKIGISSVSATVNGTEMGSEVLLNVSCEIRLLEEGNREYTLPLDCYLCSCGTENSYGDFVFGERLGKIDECWEYRERADVETEGNVRDVVFTSAIPKITDCTIDKDGLHISGEIKASGVGCEIKDDGAVEYVNLKFTTKFDKKVNISCQDPTNSTVTVMLKSTDAACEVDSNSVYLTMNLHLNGTVREEKTVKCLTHSDVREDQKFEANPSRITVYYPEEGDTLYGIAKEFHTTRERILLNNSLSVSASADQSDSVLAGVKKLIIT